MMLAASAYALLIGNLYAEQIVQNIPVAVCDLDDSLSSEMNAVNILIQPVHYALADFRRLALTGVDVNFWQHVGILFLIGINAAITLDKKHALS